MSSQVKPKEDWVRICAVEDIPVLGARVVKAVNGNIAVFRNAEGRIFALLDRCPHKGGPLSQGIVHDHTITCPLHSWKIDLVSGEAVAPDHGCARTIATRIADGDVFLQIG